LYILLNYIILYIRKIFYK